MVVVIVEFFLVMDSPFFVFFGRARWPSFLCKIATPVITIDTTTVLFDMEFPSEIKRSAIFIR